MQVNIFYNNKVTLYSDQGVWHGQIVGCGFFGGTGFFKKERKEGEGERGKKERRKDGRRKEKERDTWTSKIGI